MEERRWTPQQEDAISARGGTLLVSAAAGSGKTAVLVQRVIERLTDPKNPGDISRLLVVTFTKAAAAEMKERIGLRLSELIAANPERHDLKRQQLLLGTASICTVSYTHLDVYKRQLVQCAQTADFHCGCGSCHGGKWPNRWARTFCRCPARRRKSVCG